MKKKVSTNAKNGDHHHGLSVHQSKNKSKTITSIHTTIRSIHNNTHSSDNQSSDAAGLTARHHRKNIKKPLVTISTIKKKSRITAYPLSVTSVGSYESPISQSSDNVWSNDHSKINIQEKTQSNITRIHQIYTPTKCPGRKLCKVSNFNENVKSNFYANNNRKKSCSRSCKIISTIIGIFLLIVTAIILAVLLTGSKTETIIATNKTAVLRWNSTGLTVAGVTGQFGNGSNQLNVPFGLAIDWSNTLYIADWSNHRVQKYLKNSSIGITVAGQASGSYNSTLNYLHYPGDVAVDWNGNVYVADTYNNRVQLWNSGSTSGVTVAGTGSTGNMSNQLNRPYGLAYDPNSGTMYISDTFNNRIMRYISGASSGSAVAGGNGGGTSNIQLNNPLGLYFDSVSNNLIISNWYGANVVSWTLGASSWTLIGGDNNGLAGNSSTKLNLPMDITLDPMGNVYIADRSNHRIQFYPVGETSGTTIIGTTGISGANATLLNNPFSVVLDNQLNLYVSDTFNSRVQKFQRY